jgi:hypothetical protein
LSRPVALLYIASAAQGSGNTLPIPVTSLEELLILIGVTAVGTNIIFYLDTQGLDGLWYTIYTSATLVAAGNLQTSAGPGLIVNYSLGQFVRLRWATTGGNATFSASITGQ